MEENLTVIVKMSRSISDMRDKVKNITSQLDYTGDFIGILDKDLRELENLVSSQISYMVTLDDRLQEIERALGKNNPES